MVVSNIPPAKSSFKLSPLEAYNFISNSLDDSNPKKKNKHVRISVKPQVRAVSKMENQNSASMVALTSRSRKTIPVVEDLMVNL